jgi:hypothetical protein
VAEKLKMDEIIFSSDSVKMKDIIEAMTSLPRHIRFRISSSDSLIIIGSHDRNKKGELLNLDINYNLASPAMKRIKRVFDLLVSPLLLIFSPVLLIITGLKWSFIRHIFQVIVGNKTWIGYGGELRDYRFLPEIPTAVISYPHCQKLIKYSDQYFKLRNIEYARNYSVWNDLRTLFSHIEKVSDKAHTERKNIS